MKYIKFLLLGTLFGIVLVKGEVISWYRIQEMFRFESFHMYGVIGSAVVLGIIVMTMIKRAQLRSYNGEQIKIVAKEQGFARYLYGGILFGIGWALTGACPGPMYILIGYGFTVFIPILLSAVLGTFLYGLIRHKLPH